MRTGYSNNRGPAEDAKFKVYGKNLAADEFNSIVKEKNKNKYKSKITDWTLRQDLKKIKQADRTANSSASNSRSPTK